MFVPSLSWQSDRFYTQIAQKRGVSHRFFRAINHMDRSLGGANGAFPIKPCEACPERWIYCELDMQGAGTSFFEPFIY
jgi:hypothetical protein